MQNIFLPGNTQNGYAAVIAISDYETNTQYGNLPACEQDKDYWSKLLVDVGFDTEIFFNQKATLSNVLLKIIWLATIARCGDYVFIHFSGHGTVSHINRVDGNNNSLIFFDGKFLSEGEFHMLLKLFKPGVRIWITTDACEAGTFLEQFNYYAGYEDNCIAALVANTSNNIQIQNFLKAALDETKGQKIAASVAHLSSSSDYSSAIDGYFLIVVQNAKEPIHKSSIKNIQHLLHQKFLEDFKSDDKFSYGDKFFWLGKADSDIFKILEERRQYYKVDHHWQIVGHYLQSFAETKSTINWYYSQAPKIKNKEMRAKFYSLLRTASNLYSFAMQGHPFFNIKGIPSKAFQEQTLMAIANLDYITELQTKANKKNGN